MEVARARVNATFGIGGAYWPETSTLFGTYEAAFLGYGCNGAGTAHSPPAYTSGGRADRHGAPATVPAVNGYTRFYSSGSIEICFLGLEEYYSSLDVATLQDYTLPICDAVTQFYRERFPHVNKTTGKTDMFPAQVIESFWCGNGGSGTNAWGHVNSATGKLTKPYSRDECPTDGAPDVAGLHAILSKLLALPTAAVPSSYAGSVAAWNLSLSLLPPLATEPCHYGGANGPGKPSPATCRKQNKQGSWCNGHTPCSPPTNVSTVVAIAGQLSDAIRQHNHENHAAYAIWYVCVLYPLRLLSTRGFCWNRRQRGSWRAGHNPSSYPYVHGSFYADKCICFLGGDEIYDAGRSGSTVSANQTWKLGKLLTRTGRILATTTGAKI